MAFFKTYQDVHNYLDSLTNRGISPSLTGIQALCQALGNPEQKYKVVQVVGTNGKTTTARALGFLLTQQGIKAGVYTSPHLISYCERYELEAKQVNAKKLVAAANKVKKAQAKLEVDITQFEFLTAVAFVLFAQEQIEVAVLEAGMGARWDATSVAWPEVGILTNVSYDHLDFLGPTLQQIAAEKAYVIRHGNEVVIGEVDSSLKPIFTKRAEKENSRLYWQVSTIANSNQTSAVIARGIQVTEAISNPVIANVSQSTVIANANRLSEAISDDPVIAGNAQATEAISYKGLLSHYDNVHLTLKGDWQRENLAKAIVAAELVLKQPLKKEAIAALANFKAPGRAEEMTYHHRKIIFDGAHNVAGLKRLLSWLKSYQEPKVFLVSIMADKQISEMLKLLLSQPDAQIVLTRCQQQRAVNPLTLSLPQNSQLIVEPDVNRALKMALENVKGKQILVVTGSLYFVGEVKQLLNLSL